jgi:hypothetical protein
MYQSSLFFRINSDIASEKHRILELFFKSYVDAVCNNEVNYIIEHNKCDSAEIFRVVFDNIEDATAIRLKGIPEEFGQYLEFVDAPI